MNLNEISETDRALIEQLRGEIRDELSLVPAYNDDFSLLRWIIDMILPRIKFSLRTISALGLDKKNFSTLEEITEYCGSISEAVNYIPGSLLGFDKEHNVISLQPIGRLDIHGLLSCMRNSDLYVSRISESEVMQLEVDHCNETFLTLRKNEKILGRQLGTIIIFDFDEISTDMLWMPGVKVITTMFSQLQEMFPDVIRKLFLINTPTFFRMLWTLVTPCLAKQTQQRISILGADWKEKLREYIGEDVLYEHWGGVRKAETPFGHIRMGGKVPERLRYDPSSDIPASKLKKLKISAGTLDFVCVNMEGCNPTRKLSWWWRVESGDIDFSVVRSGNANLESDDSKDVIIWPRFRLQTQFVPESGEDFDSSALLFNGEEINVY
uniref:CRAL-TRIO domain-containing protein n=1 Tax=Setaria digitata TaxID=48799 RepID=A0A915PTD0_9BILA